MKEVLTGKVMLVWAPLTTDSSVPASASALLRPDRLLSCSWSARSDEAIVRPLLCGYSQMNRHSFLDCPRFLSSQYRSLALEEDPGLDLREH